MGKRRNEWKEGIHHGGNKNRKRGIRGREWTKEGRAGEAGKVRKKSGDGRRKSGSVKETGWQNESEHRRYNRH